MLFFNFLELKILFPDRIILQFVFELLFKSGLLLQGWSDLLLKSLKLLSFKLPEPCTFINVAVQETLLLDIVYHFLVFIWHIFISLVIQETCQLSFVSVHCLMSIILGVLFRQRPDLIDIGVILQVLFRNFGMSRVIIPFIVNKIILNL